jgi:hypothetical protein
MRLKGRDALVEAVALPLQGGRKCPNLEPEVETRSEAA